MEKKNSPDYTSAAYESMSEAWTKTQEFWEGSKALRKSNAYLTKFSRESDSDYNDRRKVAELFNVFRGTIQTVVGMVFKSKVLPGEAPTALEALYPDIDLMGNDLSMFLRATFTNAVRDGHSFILVDAPRALDPTAERVTLADVRNRRPFWRNYKASQIVNWRFETVDGQDRLIQASLHETVNEPDGEYGEKEVEQWRVLRPGSYTIERKNDKGDIFEYELGVTGIDEIPLVCVYGNKRGLFESDPPYMELLETNCTHYNAISVLRTALKYIVPMPVFTVDSEDDAKKFANMTAAANRSIVLWGENPSAQYLELKGASIQELRIDIENLEKRMAKQGVEKFAPVEDNSPKTAYEVGSDNRKQMSEIGVMAKNLEDAVETAFLFTGQYLNAMGNGSAVDPNISVRLMLDYDKLTYNVDQMEFVRGLVNDNLLSVETFLEILPQVVELPEGFDPIAEREKLLRQRIDAFPEI